MTMGANCKLLRPAAALAHGHFLLCMCMCCSHEVDGGNPLVPSSGMADSNIHRFNGSFYYFGTHDHSAQQRNYKMLDWWVWESKDLVHWSLASQVWPNVSLPWSSPGARAECWATDAAHANGTYFFYVSVGGTDVGVVSSPSPKGPWRDPLGKPLLSASLASRMEPPTTFRDPCIFQDDDGAYYIISGVFNYYIARLGRDMISLAEEPQYLRVVGQPVSGADCAPGTAGCGINMTDDMPFLHKNNQTYYLSWGNFYATSRTGIRGPFHFAGSVIDTAKLAPPFRMNNSKPLPKPGKPQPGWFHGEDYTDRHGSFLHYGGQWYFSTNDRSHSPDRTHPQYLGGGDAGDGDSRGVFRDTVMCYIHFRADGSMEPCAVDAIGVGQYDASRRIEAENFYWAGRALPGAAGTSTSTGASTGGGVPGGGPTDFDSGSRSAGVPTQDAPRKIDLRAEGGGDGFAVGLVHGSELHFPNLLNLRDLAQHLPGSKPRQRKGQGRKQAVHLRLRLRFATSSAPVPPGADAPLVKPRVALEVLSSLRHDGGDSSKRAVVATCELPRTGSTAM